MGKERKHSNYYPNTFQTPNALVDTDITKDWNESEFRVFNYFARQLTGWDKDKDWCTISHLAEEVFLSRGAVSKAIKNLTEQGVLVAKDKDENILKTPKERQSVGQDHGKIYYTIRIYEAVHADEQGVHTDEQDAVSQRESTITNKKDKTNNKHIDNSEKNKKLKEIFQHWVDQKSTVSHRKFKSSYKSAIQARLKDGFTVDEIKQAITNYDKNNRAANSYWSYDAWSLKQFLSRDSGGHVETFLEKPKTHLEDGSNEFKFHSDEDDDYDEDWGFRPTGGNK